MELHKKVASLWLQRLIRAAFSPEFYRTVVTRRFRHPETGNMVVFHSLPHEMQKKIHDQWSARQDLPSVQVRRKDFQRMRDRARDMERGFDPDEEAAAAKADRKEMAQEIKRLKERKVPARILQKEKRRLLQELESRRMKRQKEREKAFAEQMARSQAV
jgi:hypothetical protein